MPPPSALALEPDEIHVWRTSLRLPSTFRQQLKGLLPSDEVERASKFYFDRDRDDYVTGRGILRTILGQYLDVEPGTIRFQYNAYGKPFLPSEHGHHGLEFNLSHSDGLAVYAINRVHKIGVDLERIRDNIDFEQIAERFFSAGEVEVLLSLRPEQRSKAFFDCWTRKEAYIKAQGQGMVIPLDSFDVFLSPGEPVQKSATSAYEPEGVSGWTLQNLELGPRFSGALATERRPNWTLKLFQFSAANMNSNTIP